MEETQNPKKETDKEPNKKGAAKNRSPLPDQTVPIEKENTEASSKTRKSKPISILEDIAGTRAKIKKFCVKAGINSDNADKFVKQLIWDELAQTYSMLKRNLIESQWAEDQVYAVINYPGPEVLRGWMNDPHDFVIFLSDTASKFVVAGLPALAVSFQLMAAQLADKSRCKKSLKRIERVLEEFPGWIMPVKVQMLVRSVAAQHHCSDHRLLTKLADHSQEDPGLADAQVIGEAFQLTPLQITSVQLGFRAKYKLAIISLFVKTQALHLDGSGCYVWHDFVPKRSCREALGDMAVIHDVLVFFARQGRTELALAMGAYLIPGIQLYKQMEETDGPEKVLGALHKILKEFKTPDQVSSQLLAFLQANIRSTRKLGSDTAKKRVKELKATASTTTTTTSTANSAKPQLERRDTQY